MPVAESALGCAFSPTRCVVLQPRLIVLSHCLPSFVQNQSGLGEKVLKFQLIPPLESRAGYSVHHPFQQTPGTEPVLGAASLET